jgi:hypothetical protein
MYLFNDMGILIRALECDQVLSTHAKTGFAMLVSSSVLTHPVMCQVIHHKSQHGMKQLNLTTSNEQHNCQMVAILLYSSMMEHTIPAAVSHMCAAMKAVQGMGVLHY